MLNRSQFDEQFDRAIGDKVERMVRPYRRQQIRKLFISVLFLVAMLVGMRMFLPFAAIIILFLGFALYFLFFGRRRSRVDLDHDLRRLLLKGVCTLVDPGFEYHTHRHLTEHEFRDSGLINMHPTRFVGEELVVWNQMELSFIDVEDKRDAFDDSQKGPDRFRGLFLRLSPSGIPDNRAAFLPDPFRIGYEPLHDMGLESLPQHLAEGYGAWADRDRMIAALLDGPLGRAVESWNAAVGPQVAVSLVPKSVYVSMQFIQKLFKAGALNLSPRREALWQLYQVLAVSYALSGSDLHLD